MFKNTLIAILVITLVVTVYLLAGQSQSTNEQLPLDVSTVEREQRMSDDTVDNSDNGVSVILEDDSEVQMVSPAANDSDEEIKPASERAYCDCDGTLTVCPGSASNVDCQSCCSTYHPGGGSDSGVE